MWVFVFQAEELFDFLVDHLIVFCELIQLSHLIRILWSQYFFFIWFDTFIYIQNSSTHSELTIIHDSISSHTGLQK